MAGNGGNSLGELFVTLGLNLSDLESDFIAADRTVSQNMARLRRESNLIQLRAEVEIGNLDEAADATQILTIRENALNEQMQIQRDRIRIAEAAYQRLLDTRGADVAETQRAAAALERERLALQRLQRSMDDLHESSSGVNQDTSDLLETFSDFGGKAAVAITAITALAGALKTASDSSVELIEKFRDLQKQSYDLNMPFQDSKEFLRQLKLGGGDYGDFEGYIRGITDAYVKGEFDDPEFVALSKYGAKITDATGRLKDFKDITEEVYQAYQKAKAAGEGIEFLQLTGGEAGIRDAIQYFERYEEAKEDAAKIFDSGIDPAELHDSERALNLLTEQVDEFTDALVNIGTPATQSVIENLFEVFRDGTQFLVENKEELQRWGFIAAEVIDTVFKELKKLNDEGAFKTAFDFSMNFSPLGNVSKSLGKVVESTLGDTWEDFVGHAEEKQKKYNEALKETIESQKKFDEVTSKTNPLNQYDTKRITQFRDEIEDLRLETKYATDEFALAQAKNDLWLERELTRKNFLSPQEETAIRELYAEKQINIEKRKSEEIQKIEEETQNRIKDITEETADIEYNLTHSAFEKQLHDIEKWKDRQLEKADTAEEVAAVVANAAAKETEAFEREVDRIKGLTQSLEDEIFEMEHSQYEVDMRRAMQKAQKALDEGVAADVVQRYLNRKRNELDKKAAESRAKGGEYTRSPLSKGSDSFQFIEFGQATKNNIQLMTDENKIRSRLISQIEDENVRRGIANEQILESTRNMIDVQSAFNNEMQKGFTIIEGAEITQWGAVDKDNVESYVRSADEIFNRLPDFTNAVIEGIQAGAINKYEGAYGADAGYGADLGNFVASLEDLGMTTREAFSYLDKMSATIQDITNNQSQKSPDITVSPNITVDLGGAYVFDNQMKKQLADDITNEVVDAVKGAFQSATRNSSYSYGN